MSTYYLSANRNKESIRLDLKTEAGRETLTAAGGTGRRARRELPARACSSGWGSRHRPVDGAQPPARRAVDQRLRPRRTRGRSRRLRPDRPGRGRTHVASPAPGRTTPPRSACPSLTCLPACTARSGWPPRSPTARARSRDRRADLAARRHRRGARLPGDPVDCRRRGAGTRWQPSSGHWAVRLFQPADGIVQVAVGNDAQWRVFGRRGGPAPTTPASPLRGSGWSTVPSLSAPSKGNWPPTRRSVAAAGWPTPGCRRARFAPWTRSTSGSRHSARGICSSTSTTRRSGPVQLPGSPLRLERLDGRPAGRCRHQHPPLLGEHDAAVREWAHGVS